MGVDWLPLPLPLSTWRCVCGGAVLGALGWAGLAVHCGYVQLGFVPQPAAASYMPLPPDVRRKSGLYLSPLPCPPPTPQSPPSAVPTASVAPAGTGCRRRARLHARRRPRRPAARPRPRRPRLPLHCSPASITNNGEVAGWELGELPSGLQQRSRCSGEEGIREGCCVGRRSYGTQRPAQGPAEPRSRR